jgi:hypothetical protein
MLASKNNRSIGSNNPWTIWNALGVGLTLLSVLLVTFAALSVVDLKGGLSSHFNRAEVNAFNVLVASAASVAAGYVVARWSARYFLNQYL